MRASYSAGRGFFGQSLAASAMFLDLLVCQMFNSDKPVVCM